MKEVRKEVRGERLRMAKGRGGGQEEAPSFVGSRPAVSRREERNNSAGWEGRNRFGVQVP